MTHEPTPEFTRFLEWQVTTALRRHERFAQPDRSVWTRPAGMLAIVLLSVLAGAAGVMAAGRVQDQAQREVLLTQQQGELRLARLQRELAESAVADSRRRVEAGVAGPSQLAAAEREADAARRRVARIELNIAEVTISGAPVQDDVTSPRVGNRDFVTERLEVDRRGAAEAVLAADRVSREVRTRVEAGLAPPAALLEADTALERARSALDTVLQKIDVRRDFLAGQLTAQQATVRRLLAAARGEQRGLRAAQAAAAARSTLAQQRVAVGLGSQRDALESQLAVLSIEQDLAVLAARIRLLEQGRIPSGDDGRQDESGPRAARGSGN